MLAPLSSLSRDEQISGDETPNKQDLLSREEMERRRLAAAQDLLRGASQANIARKYGVSRTTASRWNRSIVFQGVQALRKRRATGRPSRLTADQIEAIRKMYFDGALAYGFSSDRWTTGRLAAVIDRRFGIHYDQDHVGRLMHKHGLRERKFVYTPSTTLEQDRFRSAMLAESLA